MNRNNLILFESVNVKFESIIVISILSNAIELMCAFNCY